MSPARDETTICRFRHLLEKHHLGEEMLETVNHHLASKGIQIATGTIVDATIIHAPSSTKNASGERDPLMHQTMECPARGKKTIPEQVVNMLRQIEVALAAPGGRAGIVVR